MTSSPLSLAGLHGKYIAIWGTGREGRAAATAVAKIGASKLVLVNDSPDTALGRAEFPAFAEFVTGDDALATLTQADVVLRSPGIPETHRWMAMLRSRGSRITTPTALWLADHAASAVAVTGSKGKSTTSTLVSTLLGAVGRPNVLGGNIGVPLLDLPEAPLYVLELSSYQCADLQHSPRIAGITNLFPEHLDWHGDEAAYYEAKLNLIRHGARHVVVHARERLLAAKLDEAIAALDSDSSPVVHVVGGPDAFHTAQANRQPGFYRGTEFLFPREVMRLAGRHNERNLCIALGMLELLGIDCVSSRDVLGDALAQFEPLPHRLSEIADPSGITFVDDTLATNPQATIEALDAYAGRPTTLIVGGYDRGVDYSPLRDHLQSQNYDVSVIGIPDSGLRIVAELRGLPALRVETAEALESAVTLARKITPGGGVVLLSPAAPSFGRFSNYLERSATFAAAIRATA